MDVRQFLLDAPETCFFSCYDLLLHTSDNSAHHLEDYHEISEVADITSGGCSLKMIAGILHTFYFHYISTKDVWLPQASTFW
ncbi:putative clustered mitochondria protein [Helianthus anomalus]